ncbi:site-specific DNA-methyltransferase [Phormidium sp. FACHB-592]|uniref:Methyltransferase n=1 Tax=Stenomitos frigidus AS-A4 TaxID=2933935 RepID=A0ABV0KFA3_9CYAN|nr:site-specific DNA-methyltransferase [Phormidium sp. FACHB-592]MBD2076516.1 site-specific DNA-methyltransferase [Phormidium sp. FACHB-592]
MKIAHQTSNGTLFCGDSLQWLATLDEASVDLIFADPPYNLKKADWDTFASQDDYIDWSMQWIQQAARILKPSGCLYVMGFSEILADLKRPALQYFQACRWLVWHYKNKANLGLDWGRAHESILLLRKSASAKINIDRIRIPYGNHTLKYPAHPQAATSQYGDGKPRDRWLPHPLGAKPKDVIELPTTCNGMAEKTKHPTQKPEALLRKLVFAASDRGDTVVDPFSGSGTTLVVAEQAGRKWLGCDLNPEYNAWAIARLQSTPHWTDAAWIEHDHQNALRRQSIR